MLTECTFIVVKWRYAVILLLNYLDLSDLPQKFMDYSSDEEPAFKKQKIQKSPTCVFDFTCSVERVPEMEQIRKHLKAVAKKWSFQQESGQSSDYLHWQGRVSLKVKVRLPVAVSMFNQAWGAGWGKLSVTSHDVAAVLHMSDDAFYVTKEDTRVEGPWCDKDKVQQREPRQYAKWKTLLPWQQVVWDSCGLHEDREINVIIDPKGCSGKSVLVGKLAHAGKARALPPLNDFKEMMALVMDMPEADTYLLDIPRGFDQKKMGGMWNAIEALKAGHVYDCRYRYRERWFDAPVVWVFMNEKPASPMTNDRWKFWKISDSKLVRVFFI